MWAHATAEPIWIGEFGRSSQTSLAASSSHPAHTCLSFRLPECLIQALTPTRLCHGELIIIPAFGGAMCEQ